MRRLRRAACTIAVLVAALVGVKALWTWHYAISGHDLLAGGGRARADLLERRRWLLEHVATRNFSTKQMPSFFPPFMQMEWAIGTLSMTSTALTNLAFLYPETQRESRDAVAILIDRLLRDDLAAYEKSSWGEDALSTLDGGNGHIGYLAHLNFMLGAFRKLGGDARYEGLHRQVSDALARRLMTAPSHYLETFPGQIFIPDNAVTIASLRVAEATMGADYSDAIRAWRDQTRRFLMDPATGLIRPRIDSEGKGTGAPRGSYAAWTIFYMNWVDREMAREQYAILKAGFAVQLPLGLMALREYRRGFDGPTDVDSGPVIFGLSTAGTGFLIGGARMANDAESLGGLSATAEAVGSTVGMGGGRHYLLAPVVGEAILLAMKTVCEWDDRYLQARK